MGRKKLYPKKVEIEILNPQLTKEFKNKQEETQFYKNLKKIGIEFN